MLKTKLVRYKDSQKCHRLTEYMKKEKGTLDQDKPQKK